MPEVSFVRRMIAPLGRVLEFRGRSTRGEHWPFMGLLFAIYVIGTMLAFTVGPLRTSMSIAYLLVLVLVLLASASVVRRLHDVGWSGWWMAAYLILAAGFVAFYFYWRYGIVRESNFANGPSLLFRIWPLLMIYNLAMTATLLLIFTVSLLDGTRGANRYGPDPQGPHEA